MRNDAAIRFPVKCPCCDQESLVTSSLDTIVYLLESEPRFRLTSECAHHRVTWIANEIERNQIEEYAAVLRFVIGAHPSRYARAVPELPSVGKVLYGKWRCARVGGRARKDRCSEPA